MIHEHLCLMAELNCFCALSFERPNLTLVLLLSSYSHLSHHQVAFPFSHAALTYHLLPFQCMSSILCWHHCPITIIISLGAIFFKNYILSVEAVDMRMLSNSNQGINEKKSWHQVRIVPMVKFFSGFVWLTKCPI